MTVNLHKITHIDRTYTFAAKLQSHRSSAASRYHPASTVWSGWLVACVCWLGSWGASALLASSSPLAYPLIGRALILSPAHTGSFQMNTCRQLACRGNTFSCRHRAGFHWQSMQKSYYTSWTIWQTSWASWGYNRRLRCSNPTDWPWCSLRRGECGLAASVPRANSS